MHSSGRGMRLDRNAAAGYVVLEREAGAAQRCGPAGNHTVPRVPGERGACGSGIVRGARGGVRTGSGTFHAVFFCGAGGFRGSGTAAGSGAGDCCAAERSATVCGECGFPAKWLWFSREQVPSLDEVEKIAAAPGEWYCAKHGARNLLAAFARIADANIFYMNLPYGEAGAYVWI